MALLHTDVKPRVLHRHRFLQQQIVWTTTSLSTALTDLGWFQSEGPRNISPISDLIGLESCMLRFLTKYFGTPLFWADFGQAHVQFTPLVLAPAILTWPSTFH